MINYNKRAFGKLLSISLEKKVTERNVSENSYAIQL